MEWPSPGYGGPVVHWWNHCVGIQRGGTRLALRGHNWGIPHLWQRTGEQMSLDKAIRAGTDLVNGQLPDGHFRNSCFELNPDSGGTPHEAAADVGLLMLARELRSTDPDQSEQFLGVARRNLEAYWFDELWHEPTATLWDKPKTPSFVPNKAATFIEAVLLLSDLTSDQSLVERYAIPTAANILAMQVDNQNSALYGAIAQNRFADNIVEAYFPLYIARCITPLLHLFDRVDDPRLRDAALSAARFLERMREPDGSFPQVLYGDGTVNRRPRWIAGAGDIIRAFLAANNMEPTLTSNRRLLGFSAEFGEMVTLRLHKASAGSSRSFRDAIASPTRSGLSAGATRRFGLSLNWRVRTYRDPAGKHAHRHWRQWGVRRDE